MKSREMLKKYYSRLTRQGILKALMWALVVGFLALLISSFMWWMFALSNVWLCAVIFAAVTAVATPIFYYSLYRPSIKKTAKRIDALGLEERVVTMTEFERETSYIAIRQREDAASAMSTISEKLIKLAAPVILVIALSVTALLGIGMTTVAALAEQGIIEGGGSVVSPQPPTIYHTVEYIVENGGMIEGEFIQVIEQGQNTEGVLAVAFPDFVFSGWSDGFSDAFRQDFEIYEDMQFYAIFEEFVIDDTEDSGETVEPSDGELEDNGEPGEDGPQPPPEGGEPNKEGISGQFEPSNQVLDGETYYGGEVFEQAYETAMQELNENSGLSDEAKKIIEAYLNNIKK